MSPLYSADGRRREPRIRGAVAMGATLSVLLIGVGMSLLGPRLPPIPGLPVPLNDPGIVAILAVVLVLVLRSDAGREPGASPGGVRPTDLLPLLLAVLWVPAAVDYAGIGIREWTRPPLVPPGLSAPLHRLGMGGALLAAVVVLVAAIPRFRERLRELASSRRVRSGLYFTVSVLVVVYAVLLWLGLVVAGPGKIRLEVPRVFGGTLALVFGQVAIAAGEEAFYRAILQGEVRSLLGRAGLWSGRQRGFVAIVAVSILFALEHMGPGLAWGKVFPTLLYAFAMSLLFGFLFELTGNVALCALAHLFNNLIVLGLGPTLAVPGPVAAFGDGVYVASFLLVTFSFLFLLGRDPSASLEPIRPT